MASCRFHAQKPARAYCPACQSLLCESCGRPGKSCALCNKGVLVDAAKAPKGVKAVRSCTVHPSVLTGIKTCGECQRPFCGKCIRFGGLCLFCAEEEQKARDALPRPELPGAETRPGPKKARKASAEQDVERKFKKGRRRTLTRWVIGVALLAPFAALIYFDAHIVQQILHMTPKKSPLASLQQLKAMAGRSGSNESYDQLVQRLESGKTTDADAAETEALMAKVTGGENLSGPERALAAKLEALKADPEAAARAAAANEHSKQIWAMLSDDSPKGAQALEPPPGVAIAPAPRHAGRHRAVVAAPAAMTVGLQGLRSGQQLKGRAVVTARLGGQEPLDHVELLVNGQWQGLSNQPPYRFEWDTSGNSNGPCTVQLVAYDASGHKHSSRAIRVTIAN